MRIERGEQLDALDFAKGDGLLTVVVQDVRDGRVLMVAWANREAVERTLATGQMHFFSRRRNRIWRKGETSGNVLPVTEIQADCDNDTLLALVRPAGPACHTGTETCFAEEPEATEAAPTLVALDALLARRMTDPPEDSYTARLFRDRNLRLKKLSEEAGELVLALADGNRDEVRSEAADLLYHVLVACRAAGVSLDDVLEELDSRRQHAAD